MPWKVNSSFSTSLRNKGFVFQLYIWGWGIYEEWGERVEGLNQETYQLPIYK